MKFKIKKKKHRRLVIEYVDIDDLKLWKDNPRRNDSAAKKLAKLIKKHGIKSPLVCTKDDTIRKGNTTWKAAKLLGYKELPVVYVEFPSKKQAELYGIADNRSSEFSEWDDGLLAELLGRRESIPAEMMAELSGFSQLEIKGLLSGWDEPEEKEKSGTKKAQVLRCPYCSKEFTLDD